MIDSRELVSVGAGRMLNLQLCRHWRSMRLTECRQFSGPGTHLNATRSAVEANPDVGGVVDNVVVVDVVHNRDIDVVDGTVVVEVVAIPIAALVTDTNVTEAVIDATVEADVGAPVAAVELIAVMPVTPVARRPERALIRSLHPNTRHPVVARRRVVPVAGGPEITITGSLRLVVVRQGRRWLVCGVHRLLSIVRFIGILIRRLII